MLPLEDPLWSKMKCGGGSASKLPRMIQRFRTCLNTGADPGERLLLQLSETCQDWTTFDGTYAMIPHLVRICQESAPHNANRIILLSWIGWCVACLRLNQTEADAQIVEWFEASVPMARDLIAESLPHVAVNTQADDLQSLRSLLAAFATCHGNAPLGFVISELESGGTQCAACGAFFLPMRSSLNPFHNPAGGT